MEQHIILKLEGEIKEKIERDILENKTNFCIEKQNENYILNYNNQKYNLKLVDLPCIIESHKTVEKQQFKVCDISQMLCMSYEEGSGLTPPLRYVKFRRFRKRSCKYNLKEIEEKVSELLEKERKAEKVEIIFGNESNTDISSLAAELEMNLETEKDNEMIIKKQEELKEIENRIKEKEQQMSMVINPIMKKRFEEGLNALKKEYEGCKEELSKLMNNN